MADSAHHCPTCTCRPGTSNYCEAELIIRHETFPCLEGGGHAGPHKGSILPAPCPNCQGYEEHSEACPIPELTTPDSDVSTGELIWTDSGEILTEGVTA
jgi:hypothetical protein